MNPFDAVVSGGKYIVWFILDGWLFEKRFVANGKTHLMCLWQNFAEGAGVALSAITTIEREEAV